jgi:hypothetical protein
MKLMKKIMAILALVSITGYSFGYNYGISNLTSQALVVRLHESGLSDPMYKVIQPDSRVEFNFGGALCLESIHVSPYSEAKGNNLASYPLYSVEMTMEPKAVYEASVKGAKDLLKGIDTLGCQALEVALKSSPESSTTKEVGDVLGDILGKGDKKNIEDSAEVSECSNCDVNTNIDASASDKAKCTWGLAKIGKAAGSLKGNDLCHSREFQILATDQPGTKKIGSKTVTVPNEWVAVTVYGE